MPAKKPPQQAAEDAPYKLPSYELLSYYGFAPEALIPSSNPQGYAGKQGSTTGIQIYPGYKGSPPICIVLLPPFEYTLGPVGPVPKDVPIVKLRARTKEEFLAQLSAAGYPDKVRMKELDKEHQESELKKWQAECDFIEFMNKGRKNKQALPKKPNF